MIKSMYNHAPINYACPICCAVNGIENDETWIKQGDIFYRDDFILGFISSKKIKGNDGHALIVPVKHFENIYELPDEYGHKIFEIAKRVARAMKQTRACDGVTLLQNNEPAGDQHAFHYHLHVIPRFQNDNFHEELWKTEKCDANDRFAHAEALRTSLKIFF